MIRPLRDFLRTEAAGGVVLVAAAVAALVWANSPAQDSYEDLWSSTVVVGFRDHVLSLDLRTWVNDGLMTVFFFVVGLEIKRELVVGELRDRRTAALPAVAALGGMAVPALLYLAFNAGGEGGRGWGIPMATDIAMAVGVLSLLGSRIPSSLKLFLLSLAIVDDIGAILVIALFYSGTIGTGALGVALLLVGAVVGLRALGVRALWPYVLAGAGLWLAVHESGVHATITGVVLGLLTPTRARWTAATVDQEKLADVSTVEAARETTVLARESVSVAEWLEHVLHPWSSYVIVPIFALANAGVVISADTVDDAVRSPIAHGVLLGLVVGKLVGITAFAWLACRFRVAELPKGVGWSGITGVAALGGIGFTVSLFVSQLAFGTGARDTVAKLAILGASVVAAALGVLLLSRTHPSRAAADTSS
jgi:NhaA family Na+:H+ antiporter